jgi:NNP family nitrate/nitrite transporter-like MFS transporter
MFVRTSNNDEFGLVVKNIQTVFKKPGSNRMLLLATGAFFMSFVIWFDMAPFLVALGKGLRLEKDQLAVLSIANLGLTIPGRVLIGRVLDKVGPRRLYGWLLILAAIPNTIFAFSHSFAALVASRLLLGLVGAGFVVGIRMISEWYGRENVGLAEGIYAGWGNAGSAVAAIVLPLVAVGLVGGADGWRVAIAGAGFIGAVYGLVFLRFAKDVPVGKVLESRERNDAFPVRSWSGLIVSVLLYVPLGAAVYVLAENVHSKKLLSQSGVDVVGTVVIVALLYQFFVAWRRNHGSIGKPGKECSPIGGISLLSFAYSVTFGAELALASVLPSYFETHYKLPVVLAGLAGSTFAITNFITRPLGGLISDVFGKRRVVLTAFLLAMAVMLTMVAIVAPGLTAGETIAVLVAASFFVQGGSGAVFAMVPSLDAIATGKVSGVIGAYGNAGGVFFQAVLVLTATTVSLGSFPAMVASIAIGSGVVGFAAAFYAWWPKHASNWAGTTYDTGHASSLT